MAIRYKNKEEIATLKEGGKILGSILKRVAAKVAAGVSTAELDKFAEEEIKKAGGRPAFKGYISPHIDHPFPDTLCVSVNEQVVHGLATPEYILSEGELISLDIGMEYKGMYTDTALTIGVGKISEQAQLLMKVTEEALQLGIDQARVGNSLKDIATAIQDHIETLGFGIVRDLVGHGVGFDVHEEPQVPNFVENYHPDIKIKEGLVIAIEPMVTAGKHDVMTEDDGWTISTADKSLAAHFEHTVAVTADGPLIITAR